MLIPQQKLEPTRPYLYTLADELLEAGHDRWNVIIGDDTAGRLPTLFVRKVLQAAGCDIPTHFVAGSEYYRSIHGELPYAKRFADIATTIEEPLRPLLVTESIDTGQGMCFLTQATQESCSVGVEPEVATVAASAVGRHYATYAGATGERALRDVWHAYESPPPAISITQKIAKAALSAIPPALKHTIKQRTSMRVMQPPSAKNTALSIEPNIHATVPVARKSADFNGASTSAWYTAMHEVAADYCRTRGLDAHK